MLILVLGLILFFGPHCLKMLIPGTRAAFIEKRGEGPWKGMVALLSVAGIGLMIWGWISYRWQAPDLYMPPDWGVHAAAVLNFVGLVLLAVSGGPVGRIKAFVVHPMAFGVAAWGIGHLFANGDLASVLLFGAWSLYAIASVLASFLRGDPRPQFESSKSDIGGIVGALVIYLVLVYFLHGFLFASTPPVI